MNKSWLEGLPGTRQSPEVAEAEEIKPDPSACNCKARDNLEKLRDKAIVALHIWDRFRPQTARQRGMRLSLFQQHHTRSVLIGGTHLILPDLTD